MCRLPCNSRLDCRLQAESDGRRTA